VSKRKYFPPPARPAAPSKEPEFGTPIVAEAATDVAPEENVTVSHPTTLTGPESAGWPPQELPVVVPEIDWRSRRISVGKLIAKHLRIPPASAQEQAAGLTEWQLNAIMETQLTANPADAIRQILQ